MNEKRIQELVEIEKQAEEILDSAKREAERLPVQAEREAQELVERTRADAHDEAQKLVEQAQAEDQVAGIMSNVQDKIRESDKLAAKNLNQAVAYVLQRVIGQE